MIRDSEFLRYDYSSVLYASENAFIFLDRYFIKMTVYTKFIFNLRKESKNNHENGG